MKFSQSIFIDSGLAEILRIKNIQVRIHDHLSRSLSWSKPEHLSLLLQILKDSFDSSGLVMNFDKMFSKRFISLIMFCAIRAVLTLSVLVLGVALLMILILTSASMFNVPVSLPCGEFCLLILLLLLLYRLIKIQFLLV